MKQKKTISLFVAVFLLISLTSCWEDFSINGNGITKTETRWVSYFDEVQSSGSFIVEIVPGDEFSIEVTAESNLLPYIITDIDKDKLKIRSRSGHHLHNRRPMGILITMPDLKEVNLSGSGYIHTGYFEADRFNVRVSGSGEIQSGVSVRELNARISGSGKITLDGDAVETNIRISGSGKVISYDLLQQFCDVTISGSGDAYVNVEKMLDVSISGSGDVLFVNTPEIHSHISGSGKVINDN